MTGRMRRGINPGKQGRGTRTGSRRRRLMEFWCSGEADPTGGSHSSLVAGETVMWLVQGGVDDTQLSVEAFLYLRRSKRNSVLISLFSVGHRSIVDWRCVLFLGFQIEFVLQMKLLL